MDDIRKNDIIEVEVSSDNVIVGVIDSFNNDKIKILVEDDCSNSAKNVDITQDFLVKAYTCTGIKSMSSYALDRADDLGFLEIKNSPTLEVNKKRDYKRVVVDFEFEAQKLFSKCKCKCVNISASGIAFRSLGKQFKKNDIIKILLPKDIFSREISCHAQILSVNNSLNIARFNYLKASDELLIASTVIDILNKKLSANE